MSTFRSSLRARGAAFCALFVLCLALSPVALAQGARVGVGRKRILIETNHFGDFYLPELIATGRFLHAFWRPKEFKGLERMVATSKNGGKTFGKARKIEIPAISTLFATIGDSAGSSYFAGLQADGTVVVVKGDSKLKNFITSAPIDAGAGVVGGGLAIGSNGQVFLALHRQRSIRVNGQSTVGDEVFWTISEDGAATFGELALSYPRVTEYSDHNPALAAGTDGAVWLVHGRDHTADRAAVPGEYGGTRLVARRIDATDGAEIELPRGTSSTGRVYHIMAAAAPGGIRVAWAEFAIQTHPPVQSVFFASYTEGSTPTAPEAALAQVGIPHFPHMSRTEDGQIVVILHGAGHDSQEPEPAIIARASTDDGATFGALRQVTGYPPVTSLFVTADSGRIYGLWTDTRVVQFAAFKAKPSAKGARE